MNIRLIFSFLPFLPVFIFSQSEDIDTVKTIKVQADTNIVPVLITGGDLQDDEAQNQDIN